MKKIFLLALLTISISYTQKCIDGNCINGDGTIQYINGETFYGTFINGKKDDFGTYFYNNSNYYGAYYKNDKIDINKKIYFYYFKSENPIMVSLINNKFIGIDDPTFIVDYKTGEILNSGNKHFNSTDSTNQYGSTGEELLYDGVNFNRTFIIDNADMLSISKEKELNLYLKDHYESSSDIIMVYTISSLNGTTIEDTANRTFNTWEIGSKNLNNGILFMIAIDDRKMRIEVGYGLEATLTDLEAKDILDYEVKPDFKKADYESGITDGVHAIVGEINGTYSVSKTFENNNLYSNNSSSRLDEYGYILVFIIILGFISFQLMLFRPQITLPIYIIIASGSIISCFWLSSVVGIIALVAFSLATILNFLYHYFNFKKEKGRYKNYSINDYWEHVKTVAANTSYSSSSYSGGGSDYSSSGGSWDGGGSSGGGGASSDW